MENENPVAHVYNLKFEKKRVGAGCDSRVVSVVAIDCSLSLTTHMVSIRN